jgi:hypothetical protein
MLLFLRNAKSYGQLGKGSANKERQKDSALSIRFLEFVKNHVAGLYQKYRN